MKTNQKKTASLDLPMSITLSDLLNELQRQFETEKNIKNNLYSFILQSFMFNELREFEKGRDMTAPVGHDEWVKMLAYNSRELVEFSPR